MRGARRIRRWGPGLLLISPSIFLIAVFVYGLIGWNIKVSTSDWRAAVESKKFVYTPGSTFYQLTKPEEVQDYKAFILRDNSGRLYAGNEDARKLMGLPSGGTFKLNPGHDPRYTFFVQSTSFNRKLMPGTDVLHRIK